MEELICIQRDSPTEEIIEEQAAQNVKNNVNGEEKEPGPQQDTFEPDVP